MSPMQPGPVTVRRRRGAHQLWATATPAGEDLAVVVGGGERPHVGCVALAQPRPSTADPSRRSATVSLLAIPPHKEGPMATEMAATLARELGVVVVVSAGVHTDGLGAEGIRAYETLARAVTRALLARLQPAQPAETSSLSRR